MRVSNALFGTRETETENVRLGTSETKTQMKTTAQAKDEGSLFRNAYPESGVRNRKEAFF